MGRNKKELKKELNERKKKTIKGRKIIILLNLPLNGIVIPYLFGVFKKGKGAAPSKEEVFHSF